MCSCSENCKNLKSANEVCVHAHAHLLTAAERVVFVAFDERDMEGGIARRGDHVVVGEVASALHGLLVGAFVTVAARSALALRLYRDECVSTVGAERVSKNACSKWRVA
jgi:hypothetical protein